jgi:hypothetical protein
MAAEYSSLRILHETHKLRQGNLPKLVQAGGGQTVTYKTEPFPHFEVQPSGIQIPLHNVASAIPVQASIADKVNGTVEGLKAKREARRKMSGVADGVGAKASKEAIGDG